MSRHGKFVPFLSHVMVVAVCPTPHSWQIVTCCLTPEGSSIIGVSGVGRNGLVKAVEQVIIEVCITVCQSLIQPESNLVVDDVDFVFPEPCGDTLVTLT